MMRRSGLGRIAAFSAALMLAAAPLVQPAALYAQASPAAPVAVATGGDIVNYDEINHPVIGHGGMVVSQNRIAAQVGVEIMRKGGNAVDAAVAVGFAAAVTLARAGNLGGGGFMLIHMAPKGDNPAQTLAIGYYGTAPRAITPDLLLDSEGKFDRAKDWSFKGVAVPGTVAGLWEAHRRYGSLKWREVVQPAIDLATRGIRLSDAEAEATAQEAAVLGKDPGARSAYLKRDGSAYRPGELFRQPELARTLIAIRDRGRDGFYKGPVAEKIVAAMAANGGIIDAQDLAGYEVEATAPVWSSYRGHNIAYMPPPSSGVTLAETMNILERFPVSEMGWGSSASLHLMSEALKVTANDRRLIGGAADWTTPVTGLVSKSYAAERATLIRPDSSLDAKTLPDGNPLLHESPDTTHYSVADAQGNVVSNTYTLSASYGAHVAAPGTGVLLNNSLSNLSWTSRAGETDTGARAPKAGTRVGSSITPVIVFAGDKPWIATGTPGGGTIIAAVAQLLSNVIDHKLNIAEAAQRPRINQAGGNAPLEVESGFSPDLLEALKARGHTVRPSRTMGSIQSIMLKDGTFLGAADTRRPDAAALPVDGALE